jgi:hypothetical protein
MAGCDASPYLRSKYVDYHRRKTAFRNLPAFDRSLLRLAVSHPWLTRVADSYSARFDRCSVLRKKLALVTAIMECSPEYVERIDTAYCGPLPLILFRMGLAVTGSAVALVASLILVAPLHLMVGRSR